MPFYIARPRENKSRVQSNAGKIDRIRSPPSDVSITTLSQRDSWITSIIFDYIHIVISLVFSLANSVTSIRVSSDKNNRVLYTPAGASTNFPFRKPGLGVVFKGSDSRLSPELKDQMSRLGFTSVYGKQGKRAVTVYKVSTYTDEIIDLLDKYQDQIDPTYTRTSYNLITYHHARQFEFINDRISNFYTALYNVFRTPQATDDPAITMTSEKWTSTSLTAHRDGIHNNTEGITHGHMEVDTDAEIGWKQYMAPFGYIRLALPNTLTSTDIQPAWGTIDQCPFTSGLSFPYIRDYSVRDGNALRGFISSYTRSMIRITGGGPIGDQLNAPNDAWIETISNTDVGQEMAHILRLAEFCRQAKTRVFFAFSHGIYQGAIAEGTFFSVIGSDGAIVRGVSDEQFTVEKQCIDRHAVAQGKILEIAKVSFGGTIKTLRQLSALVQTKVIDGEGRSTISELLAEVDYREAPLTLHPDSLETLYSLILSDSTVPHSYFLRREDFFVNHVTEKVRSALSIFGDNTPTFQTGNKPRPVILSAGTAKTPYSPGAPKVLQVERTSDTKTAESQWKSIIATRIINGEWERRKEKARVFEGDVKTTVWAGMEKFLSECARRDTGKESSEIKDGIKRGAEDSTEENLSGGGKRSKKDLSAAEEEMLDLF